jgi:hypothetical protein
MGYVSHSEAIAHQRKSQVLLLIEIDSEETLKHYQVSYLNTWFQQTYNCYWSKDSDFAEIIKTEIQVRVFEYDEKQG